MRHVMHMRRAGLALLVSVGVLGVLSLLAAGFLTLARLERAASLQRVQASRARLLARSALEDALARLTRGQGAAYGGEDWNGDGVLGSGPEETGSQVFRPTALDVAACPVRHAMRPSFFRSSGGDPRTLRVDGRLRGVSAELGGGAYALKVEDESAKLCVNGGLLDLLDRDLDGIPDHRDPDVRAPADPRDTGTGWNAQLLRVLNLLGADPKVSAPGLGTAALTLRPPGGWRSIRELEQAFGTSQDLSPFLTTAVRPDRSVVHPNAWNQPPQAALSDVKKDRRPLALEAGGRPAVNLEAAPLPVLKALLSGLQGVSWHSLGQPWPCAIDAAKAAEIAGLLAAFRTGQDPLGIFWSSGIEPGPFRTWGRFAAFADALVPAVLNDHDFLGPGGPPLAADLLKANFDPNTRLNKELPDQILWKWIDKSDLRVWSTEGELGPSGVFRVSACARILDPAGRLLSEAGASTTVEAFRLLRQTSQADFVAGRVLGDAPAWLSRGTLPLCRTTGTSASWGAGEGLAVATYPCPPQGLPAAAAAFDGAVGLATTEAPATMPAGATRHFLHRFDDTWKADEGGAPDRVPFPNSLLLQTDPGASTWPGGGIEPGTLYPDGVHSQTGRSAAFAAEGNLPPSFGSPPQGRGAFGYWVKQLIDPAIRGIEVSVVRWTPPETHALMMGRQSNVWGICAENSVSPSSSIDVTRERQYTLEFSDPLTPGGARLPGLRWRFAAGLWNTSTQTVPRDCWAWAHGLLPPDSVSTSLGYAPFNAALGEVLCDSDTYLAVGGQLAVDADFVNANQVLDELEVCSFGPDPAAALLSCQAWALNRFLDGRYYKGDDGRFLSAALLPETGGAPTLLFARWTATLPSEDRWETLPWEAGSAEPPILTKRALDPLVSQSRIRMTLTDGAGAPQRELVPGAPLGLRLPAFRYQAAFEPRLESPLDQPLLETPFLEDVTFAWQPSTGPSVLAWDP